MRKNKIGTGLYVFSIAIFAVYITLLLYILFFSQELGRDSAVQTMLHDKEGVPYANIVPFKEIKRFINGIEYIGIANVIYNIAGNIIMFMPFGFFVPVIFRFRIGFFLTLLMGCAFSAICELIQYIIRVGTCDIDDVILNTTGVVLGFLILVIVRAIVRHSKKNAKRSGR